MIHRYIMKLLNVMYKLNEFCVKNTLYIEGEVRTGCQSHIRATQCLQVKRRLSNYTYSKNFVVFHFLYSAFHLNLISAFSSVSSSSFDSFRSVRSNGSGASQRSVFSSSGGGGGTNNNQNGSWFSIPSLSNFQSAAGIFDSKLMNRPPRVGQFFRMKI